MYIHSIRLRNIRAFEKLELQFRVDGAVPHARMATVIIGLNGTCKTTLLRAIALGLCPTPDANALLAEPFGDLLSRDAETGEIEIELLDSLGNVRTLCRSVARQNGREVISGSHEQPELDPMPLICGYGVHRGVAGPEVVRPYRILDSVYSLFNYEATLIDPELTLRRLKDYLRSTSYTAANLAIRRAVGLGPSDGIDFVRGGGVEITTKRIKERIPLQAWADGYRLTFAWIMDFYAWAMRSKKLLESGDVQAVLLVDELEQHLHTSMQIELADRLRKLLPLVQVIGTTHSPLVALGAGPDSVVPLKRRGRRVILAAPPDSRGASAEDVLVHGDLFDTAPHQEEVEKKLREYRRLASRSKNRLSSSERRQLERLEDELRAPQVSMSEDALLRAHLQATSNAIDGTNIDVRFVQA